MRQGGILSPLLYCIFVDELLDLLEESGRGAWISDIFCGSPMYADDLALVADSADNLQALLNVVYAYSRKWRYQLNADKSVVLVIGECACKFSKFSP